MMRIKLRHLPLAAGSLFFAACADDAVSQDTDASSSESSDSDPSDSDPTTIDPDSSSGGSSTDTPTTTSPETTADSSSSSGGGTCLIPSSIIADPSFESNEASEWGVASSAFGTPLCDDACGGPPAQDGSWYVWLGGSPGGDVGGVSQEVTIGEADELTLSFYFFYGVAGSGTDVFQLQIDGDVLWEVTNADAADYADWTLVEIDVSAYADGGDHDIDFTGSASGNANLYLDNVLLETCGDGGSVTMSDTVDPAATSGETDSTTDTDTGGMLTCEDIGNTVPHTEDGDNTGSGDDIVGSCLIGGGDGAGEDVAFTWTAPADGIYRFDTDGSALDTVLILLDACDSGANELACNDDFGGELQSATTLAMTQDQTIAIVVDGWSSADLNTFSLHITEVGCDDPEDLGNNLPVEQDDDNTGAGDDIAATCGGAGGEDVVYTWTAPDDGIYSIYAVSLQMAPVISAYAGTCGSPGDELGCATGNGFAAFNTVVAADQEISIVVDGAGPGESGTYELNIEQAGVLAGDCCVADDSPGCEDAAVTQCTCAVDLAGLPEPYPVFPADCCSGEWTEACASLAATQCGANACALTPGGSCCDGDSGNAGCDVDTVQNCVCDFDAFCCDNEWDAVCVSKAQLFCFAECQ